MNDMTLVRYLKTQTRQQLYKLAFQHLKISVETLKKMSTKALMTRLLVVLAIWTTSKGKLMVGTEIKAKIWTTSKGKLMVGTGTKAKSKGPRGKPPTTDALHEIIAAAIACGAIRFPTRGTP